MHLRKWIKQHRILYISSLTFMCRVGFKPDAAMYVELMVLILIMSLLNFESSSNWKLNIKLLKQLTFMNSISIFLVITCFLSLQKCETLSMFFYSIDNPEENALKTMDLSFLLYSWWFNSNGASRSTQFGYLDVLYIIKSCGFPSGFF